MAALARFLTKWHKKIFIVMMVLTVASACMLPFSNVNKDMTKYIPSYMQSKVGMDLMSQGFGDASVFRMMFENIPDDQKTAIADQLEALDCVTSVTYDESSDYNRGNYTLYEAAVLGGTYSAEANQAYADLQEFAESTGYTCHFDSPVIDAAMPNLGLIIFGAMIILTVILLAMSKSWFEPVLLLVTLGIAVALNMGTNIIFESVSDTTFSIAGVFQLVLSLDYSVMLMSRYRSERANCSDPHACMESALRNATGSIASSSITTIAGMVCLVLMSFTIGRDMGLVLAKGVLFSLICVFTVLPTLIILSDGILQRTAKRSFHPAMGWWARISDVIRMPLLVAFLLVFASGFALRGLAEASFTLPSLNADHAVVEEVFPNGSQVVVLYETADEEAAADVVAEIGEMAGVKSVMAYSNTLGMPLSTEELAEQMGIDESFVKLLLRYRDSGDSVNPMTLHEFATLVQNDIAGNSSFASQLDGYDLSQVSQLAALTDASAITCQRSAASMASFLQGLGGSQAASLGASEVQQIYLLYYINHPSEASLSPMSLPTFVSFLLDEVATNPQYRSMFTEEQLAQLEQMRAYTNPSSFNAQKTASQLAEEFDISELGMKTIFFFLGRDTMSTMEFIEKVVSVADKIPVIEDIIGTERMAQLRQVLQIMQLSESGALLDYSEMASLLGMDADTMRQLYLLHESTAGSGSSWTMSAYDMVGFLISDEAQEYLSGMVDSTTISQMRAMHGVMTSAIAGTSYTPAEMATQLSSLATATGSTGLSGMDAQSLTLLYLYRDAQLYGNTTTEMTIDEFVDFMADDVANSSLFTSFIDDDMRSQLADSQKLMDSARENFVSGKYNRIIIKSSYSGESDEMTAFLGDLQALLDSSFSKDYYLVGEGPMALDMTGGFMDELNTITLVTAAAIFLIVLLTFRNLLIPLVLVGLIQSSYFWTMVLNGLLDWPMYYVAIIIVQAILMGATIDYAILYTSQYRENRLRMHRREATAAALKGSVGTMLTSGSILVLVTFVIGIAMKGSAVAQICLTIAEGAFIALLLVIFLLPGILAALDRWIAGRNRLREGCEPPADPDAPTSPAGSTPFGSVNANASAEDADDDADDDAIPVLPGQMSLLDEIDPSRINPKAIPAPAEDPQQPRLF